MAKVHHVRRILTLTKLRPWGGTEHPLTRRLYGSLTDNFVKVTEVGPRDGLQNEKTLIALATKLALIERLASTGLTDVEAGSFVSPKWVPQMADSSKILETLLENPPRAGRPMTYSFLVPNTRGLDNALSLLQAHAERQQRADSPLSLSSPAPSTKIAIFVSATETFSQKNLNCSIQKSLDNLKPVVAAARAAKLRVRAYVSVVLGCPFEGPVSPSAVVRLVTSLLALGVDEIDLGDTTGMGTKPTTTALLRSLRAAGVGCEDLTMHFHDTYGMALINTVTSLEHGVRSFDGSVAGLGGCPYSPGATGNVATEDLVYLLSSLGMETSVDLETLAAVGDWVSRVLGKVNNGSRVGSALMVKKSKIQTSA